MSTFVIEVVEHDNLEVVEEVLTLVELDSMVIIQNEGELNNISDEDAAALTDGGSTSLHTHDYNNLENTPVYPDKLSDLGDDENHRLVTDTEKSTWNGKAAGSHTHDDRYYTETEVNNLLTNKQDSLSYTPEDTNNKVSSWSSTTNNTRYPGEKLVKDSLDGKANSSHHHNSLYYTESQIDTMLLGKQDVLGFTPENSANKGTANGYAELDETGKVPSNQLPSYVDDVLEYSDYASFPLTGESGKIYIDLATNYTYRWGGSAYVQVGGGGVALGETSSTAYRGDRGKTAYEHSQLTTGNPHSVSKSDVGLGNVDNTSDNDKPISSATQSALDGKSATGHDHDSAYSAIVHNHSGVYSEVGHNHSGTYEPALAGATSKGTFHDDDRIVGLDSEATNETKYWLWSAIKTALASVFESITNKKLDLTDNSDTYYPSQKAVKTAVDAKANTSHTQAESTITFTDITDGNASNSNHGYLPKLSNDATQFLNGQGNWATPSGSGGVEYWTDLSGTYASTSTFTFTGTAVQAAQIALSLFTCLDSAGTTRRYGYVKSASESSGTVTVTVVTDSDLASGDKDFKIAYSRKIYDYSNIVSLPFELVADSSNPVGLRLLNVKQASKLLPVDFNLVTAAVHSGTGVVTVNLYSDSSALFSSAPDLAETASLVEQRPTTRDISAGVDISLRVTAITADTTKPYWLQCMFFLVPETEYTGAV